MFHCNLNFKVRCLLRVHDVHLWRLGLHELFLHQEPELPDGLHVHVVVLLHHQQVRLV